MTTDDVKQWLTNCSQAEREEVFGHLRRFVGIHRLEQSLHATAEVILEAIDRAGGLTVRMFRGVMAGAAFDVTGSSLGNAPSARSLHLTGYEQTNWNR